MHNDDRTEMRFLGVFYGLIALVLGVFVFVMLAGAHLLSLAAIVIPLFIAMALLWLAVPNHGGPHRHH